MNFCISNYAPDDGNYPDECLEAIVFGYPKHATPAPTDAAAVTALLASAGITPAKPVCECRDMRRRPGSAKSWLVVLEKDATVPASVWERWNVYRDGNRALIIQFKEG